MYIGIDSSILNKRFAVQRDSMWCWAAAVQMIFHHYGLDVPQEVIVRRTFGLTKHGTLPNKPGDFIDILKSLNTWGLDRRGKHYRVHAEIYPGAPSAQTIIEELAHQRPILFSYRSRPRMNHAVVITGAELITRGNGVVLKNLVVRDPSPYPKNIALNGRREYRPSTFLAKGSAYWLIRV